MRASLCFGVSAKLSLLLGCSSSRNPLLMLEHPEAVYPLISAVGRTVGGIFAALIDTHPLPPTINNPKSREN